MKFNVVIFDLFGTLVDHFGSSIGQMHAEMATALAVPYERFLPVWNQTLDMRITGDFQTVEANIEYVLGAMKIESRSEQTRKAVEVRMKYIRRALQPRPDAVETLRRVKSQRYHTGLLSNCSIEIPLLWQETPFADVIDSPIFSSRARLKKPDARIYQLACERLGVAPNSSLYVADGEDYELAAAAKVGLQPVLIRNPFQQTDGRLHAEAREWQGTTITSLREVLDLLN
jgi:putative hydrolase of the HAD superfamily